MKKNLKNRGRVPRFLYRCSLPWSANFFPGCSRRAGCPHPAAPSVGGIFSGLLPQGGTLQSGFSCGFAAIHLLTSSRRVTACTICLDCSRRAGCPHPAAVNRCISFKPVLLMWCCGWGAFRLLQLALQERREILCSPSEGGGGWCPDSFSPSAAFIFPSTVNLTKLFYASVSFFGILYMI